MRLAHAERAPNREASRPALVQRGNKLKHRLAMERERGPGVVSVEDRSRACPEDRGSAPRRLKLSLSAEPDTGSILPPAGGLSMSSPAAHAAARVTPQEDATCRPFFHDLDSFGSSGLGRARRDGGGAAAHDRAQRSKRADARRGMRDAIVAAPLVHSESCGPLPPRGRRSVSVGGLRRRGLLGHFASFRSGARPGDGPRRIAHAFRPRSQDRTSFFVRPPRPGSIARQENFDAIDYDLSIRALRAARSTARVATVRSPAWPQCRSTSTTTYVKVLVRRAAGTPGLTPHGPSAARRAGKRSR
jgi:hypothetical protein